jgi:hypothetical protein
LRHYLDGTVKGGVADMRGRNRTFVVVLAALALIAVSNGGGAQLKLALEDRADPNPHQVSLGVELAGICLGVVISWTNRLRPDVG